MEISAELDELKVLQEQDSTGITSDKKNTHEDLIASLVDVSGTLQSHSFEKKDSRLYEKISFSENELSNFNQSKLNTVALTIIGEAEKVPAEDLLEQGIDAKDITDLKELHQAYTDKMNAPKEHTIERSNYTFKIAQLVNEGWELRQERLDKLISQFKRKDPDYYLKYQAASHLAYYRSRKNNNNDEPENDIEEAEG